MTVAAAPDIVPMRWWHLPAVAEVERAVFGTTAWSLEQFYGELAADRWLRVALDRQAVAGYADVAVAGRDADLMTIAVAPSYRGRGLGAALLDQALAAAAAAGADRMLLEVRADNPAAELYRSRGFERIDRRRDYYGSGVDALVLRARLTRQAGAADG